MAYKRSRAVFEADNFAVYGTPLPPLDPEVRDDGSFVPVWKQEAVDERGRKRFHGAFTGGFSAGYFNSVGSKEGWAPSTFVSSRTNRAKDQKKTAQQRPEDFMDDEDLVEQEQAKQLQTNDAFSGLGTTTDDSQRRGALMDLMRPRTSVGVQLLQKMGWREGQGIGQRVRRRAKQDNGAIMEEDEKEHLFAPENTKMIEFLRKTDRKGLGFAGEQTLGHNSHPLPGVQVEEDDDASMLARSRSRFAKDPKPRKKAGIGVGILNDNGSDEEDAYEMGPKISYNRTLGPTKKPKKPSKAGGLIASSSNPLLPMKPVFIPKKKVVAVTSFRKCHDGRLPLDGFILSSKPLDFSSATKHPPPKVPQDWTSNKTPSSSNTETSTTNPKSAYQTTADAARTSSLNPTSRASLLGETQLPGKSIFAFLTPSARDRLASATGKTNLPAAGNEAPPPEFRKTDDERQKQAWKFVPSLDAALAKSALARTSGSGFMPYADDEEKRARYLHFLEVQAGIRETLPLRANGASTDEWTAEMREFAQAAQVFRPMSGMMASRFTSSSSSTQNAEGGDGLLRKPEAKPQDPAEQAAQMRMFGPLTRSVRSWAPTRLLCKRFGVRPPALEELDPGDASGGDGLGGAGGAAFGMGGSMANAGGLSTAIVPTRTESVSVKKEVNRDSTPDIKPQLPVHELTKVDVERNEALERQRPGDAVFKAIFGSDDEDEDD